MSSQATTEILNIIKEQYVQTVVLDLCINVLCHAGEECIVIDNNAACMCKKSCPNHEKPVCGSNGMTYPNHCELHKTACLEEKKLSIKYMGACRGQPTQAPSSVEVNYSKPGRLFSLCPNI